MALKTCCGFVYADLIELEAKFGTGKTKAYCGNQEASLHVVGVAKADDAVCDACGGASTAPSYPGEKSAVGSA